MENLNMITPSRVQGTINKFCYTIGILPTSYKQSLTYEEQILWISHFLETTIYPAINNNAEALAELQELFIALKDYVDNYFDNLDVQEEINNKIDEMVESGELQELIAAYINTNAIISFNSVDDMINSTALVNGSTAKTLGYYAKNDGGTATYKIRTITNDDIVDGGSLIAMTNTDLVAELIPYNHEVTLKQFGCYGDNFHDDSTNIQNAINYFVSNKKIKLISDKAIYKVTNSIEIENDSSSDYYTNKEIDFSLATFTTTENINVFELSATWLEISIGSITKTGANQYVNGTGLLLGNKVWHCLINVRSIIGFQYGIRMLPTLGIMHNRINWTYLTNHINIYGDINGSYINQNEFHGGNIGAEPTDTTSYGIYITDTSEVLNKEFNGNLFERVAFEIVAFPIYLEHCRFSKFTNFRMNEHQITNNYITCHDCNNMVFETNDGIYFNEPTYISDDFTLENDNIGNWNANCNKYKINQGKQSLAEISNFATSHYFTIINNQVIYFDFSRKTSQEYYMEASSPTTQITLTSIVPYTWFQTVLGAGNIELSLPQKYAYNNSLYDELVVNIHHKLDNHKLIIKDYAGTTIFDSSNYTFDNGMNIDKKFIIKTTGKPNQYVVIDI